MTEAIRAAAHCAHTLSRLAIDYRRMADEFPNHRQRYIEEAAEYRERAWWYLGWARRMKECES